MSRRVSCRLVSGVFCGYTRCRPPFSVPEAEVRALFGAGWDVERLERRDILEQQPGFAAEGVTALHTAVYRLQRKES